MAKLRIKRKGNMREWAPRARHHARKLLELAQAAQDIFSGAQSVMALKSRVRIYTVGAAYIIRPYKVGGRYMGIEVKKFGARESIKLKVV